MGALNCNGYHGWSNALPAQRPFINPNDAVIIRVQDMTWLKWMRSYHEFLPIGTIIRAKNPVSSHDWIESHVLDRRQGLTTGGFGLLIDYDRLLTGEVIEWTCTGKFFEEDSMFMLLGHVVFPWGSLNRSGRTATVEPLSENLCIQIWQPLNDNNNKPFAGNFFSGDREVVILGGLGYKTTKYHKNEIMPGLNFELADKTLLDYQSPLVRGFVSRLEKAE